jgi:hypothetical protein
VSECIYLSSTAGKPQVDREAGVIRGFKVATLGEAKGHGVIVDDQTLAQLISLGNADLIGIKSRFWHPDTRDGLGSLIGFASNFRRDGDSVIADLTLSPAASKSPLGDLADYILTLAESAPSAFGASPSVKFSTEKIRGQKLPSLRITKLRAVDLVDEPATNDGLFEAGKGDMPENVTPAGNSAEDVAKIKEELRAEFNAKFAEIETQHAKDKADAVALAAKEAGEKALTDESKRQADILSLCNKAKLPNLAEGYLKEKLTVAQVQEKLLSALCEANKPVGDDAGKPQADPDNAKFLQEYELQKAGYLKAGISADDYVASRRIDCGLDLLKPKLA